VCGTVVLETVIVLLAIVGGIMFHSRVESGQLPAWGLIPYTARYGVLPLIGGRLSCGDLRQGDLYRK